MRDGAQIDAFLAFLAGAPNNETETVGIAFLFVLFAGPPEATADYLDRYVAQEGDTVKLLCPIVGNPKPIIEWDQVYITPDLIDLDTKLKQEARGGSL